ncbi:cation:proton antiporter subunit C [Natronococcus jeotgali]|uniref:NADH-ubiquinone oxidoreductase chain 4L n=1 Tax=Natronococcus jeotgali DSM 18795 TaxID=1227498 RepID=L9WZQ5_9EURY|nr:cation:proton antiporter subunit C [Natronococcus jeotgali]ELY54872.1 NADH-ubiquinone oxidoreductase chain 4L [Natronococcus jeotgali DSM 18795]
MIESGLEILASRYAYALMFVLMGIGLYMVIANENLVKKLIGVNLFQTAIFLFFIAVAYVEGGSAPIVPAESGEAVASPLPQVIVLTAIVVGIALTAVGLALVVRIYAEYGTLREDTLREVRADE